MKRLFLLLFLAMPVEANQQDGSLNNYHGENSVANSNNTTTDTSSTTENTYLFEFQMVVKKQNQENLVKKGTVTKVNIP